MIVPNSRPQRSRDETLKILVAHSVLDGFALVGDRGYYLNSMGRPGKNDINIYDDAMTLITPNVHVTFNANVDPSVTRPRVATLVSGLYQYRLGTHGLSKPKARQYRALVQAGPVTVRRHGVVKLDTGYFGINIHRGAARSTSSLGCQTIYPTQWAAFIALVEAEMKRAGRPTIPYILTENPDGA